MNGWERFVGKHVKVVIRTSDRDLIYSGHVNGYQEPHLFLIDRFGHSVNINTNHVLKIESTGGRHDD